MTMQNSEESISPLPNWGEGAMPADRQAGEGLSGVTNDRTPASPPDRRAISQGEIEIIPAILHNTFEAIAEDWNKVIRVAKHIHIDITDGIFAGNESFLDIVRLRDLPASPAGDPPNGRIELHMMVQTPADYVDDIIDLNPGRCIFHIESFLGTLDLPFVYNTVGEYTSSEMGIAINPDTDIARLTEYLPLVQYVLFMGYNPGFAGQDINPEIFKKIASFHTANPAIQIAVDGHVDKSTIAQYAESGASIFCSNTAIFRAGSPEENIKQLELLAKTS